MHFARLIDRFGRRRGLQWAGLRVIQRVKTRQACKRCGALYGHSPACVPALPTPTPKAWRTIYRIDAPSPAAGDSGDRS